MGYDEIPLLLDPDPEQNADGRHAHASAWSEAQARQQAVGVAAARYAAASDGDGGDGATGAGQRQCAAETSFHNRADVEYREVFYSRGLALELEDVLEEVETGVGEAE